MTLTPYRVMLSRPNMDNLSYVELLDGNGTRWYKSDLREPVLTPEENDTDVVPPFNAYSAPGDIEVSAVLACNFNITLYDNIEGIVS